ncbi:hypothetical protein DUI87_10683 [Hirundo rustica rustica]|uniref:RNA-directed DNA polymerase from mobile element jockey n=1 Tax=Hirundo rustica rustica TaxID=333673 RepID=A0A3M0KIT7_HIRRU|nr:hypothetical protein DUI87_10683 [Hirundo rustica rustica]
MVIRGGSHGLEESITPMFKKGKKEAGNLQRQYTGKDNWPPEPADGDGEQKSPLAIQEKAVSNLLSHLDARKSMGPDGIHPRVTRELVEKLAKLLSIVYHQSWLTGEVPDDWKLPSVMSIHNKGQKVDLGKLQSYQPDLSAQQDSG